MKKIKLPIATVLIAALIAANALTFSVLGFAISRRMEASIRETTNTYSEMLIEQIQYNLNSFYEDLDNIMYNFITNDTLIDAMKSLEQMNPYDKLLTSKDVRQMISSYTKSHEEISELFILNQDSIFALNPSQFRKTDFVKEILEEYPSWEYIKPQYYPIDYPAFCAQDNKRKEMTISLPIRNYREHDKKNYGIILASVRTDSLDKMFSALKTNDLDVSVLDENNVVYYSSDASLLNTPYDFETAHQLQVAKPLNVHNWQIVITSELTTMFAQLKAMRRTVTLLVFAAIILISFIIRYIANRIAYPVKYMANQMSTLDYERLSQSLPHQDSYLEIDQLYDGYNKMLKRIENLIDTVSYERLRQKEAHFEALQSKINPHFLYNTLQSIYSLAVLERHEDVEVVTIALSDMLEYITYEKASQVLLSQELAYINNYLEIQKRRYNNCFSVEYHIDEAAKNCMINKLLIQPIVENAVNHGFAQLTENGFLMISAYVSAEDLLVEVTDNGIGMNAQTLDELIKRIHEPQIQSTKKSIGLSNIQERIQLKYGPGYGLTVMSKENDGTRILLRIPAIYKEETTNGFKNSAG